MSFLIVHLGAANSSVADLMKVSSALTSAAQVVSGPTTNIPPPAADEVSSLITGLFNSQGTGFQDVVAAFIQLIIDFILLIAKALSFYAGTESSSSGQLGGSLLGNGLVGGLVGGLL